MHKKLKKKSIQYALLIDKHTPHTMALSESSERYYVQVLNLDGRYVRFKFGGCKLLCRINYHDDDSLTLMSFLGQESNFLLLLQAVQDWIAICPYMTFWIGRSDCYLTGELHKRFNTGSDMFVVEQLPTSYVTLHAGTISYVPAFLVVLNQQNKGMFGRVDKSICNLLLSLLGKTSYVMELVKN